MLKIVGVLALLSAGVNTWWFVIRPGDQEEIGKARVAKENAADPLLNENVQYEKVRPPIDSPKDRDNVATRSDRRSPDVTNAGESSEEGKQYKKKSQWKAVIPEGPVIGNFEFFEHDGAIRSVEFKLGTQQPRERTVEEVVQGVKRIWLRSVEGRLSDVTGLQVRELEQDGKKNGAEGGVAPGPQMLTLSGKAKAYVQLDQKRIRTVVDVFLSLVKEPNQSAIAGTFSLSRLESDKLDGKKVFVVDVGTEKQPNFAIMVHGAFLATEVFESPEASPEKVEE